jgi:outer membrane protein TolC
MNNNFKLGISFSMPIPNRTSIGAIKNADFKIKSSTYEMNLIENNLQNKIQYYYTEVINIKTQIILSKAYLENFKKLFEIEKTKFELGESTLFMINSRELKMIESNQKLIELNAKFKISLANLKNASSIE